MPRRRDAVAFLAAVIVTNAGCEGRNPESISRQRQPALYAPAPAPATTAPAATEPPDGDKTIPGDDAMRGHKLDFSGPRAGRLTIDVNDPMFVARLDPLFDGDTATLSRTESVNPLVITFRFPVPVHLTAVRILPSYSSYEWSVEVGRAFRAMLVRAAAPDVWSAIVLPEDVETDTVRVTLRRLERDDYVHVNEIELWASPSR
jgi:hypothetical protein